MRAIDRIGEREIRATAEIAARFSERPARAIRDILEDDAPLAAHVREVRGAAVTLARLADAPRRADSGRVASEISRSQESMRALVTTLDAQRAALMADNAELSYEERALFHEIQTLRRYATLAARIEDLVEEHSASIAALRPDDARVLQTEILYALRQRRRDVLVQLTVASQAYASLRLIEQNNLEVIWALRSAASTTLAALRTAGLAARTLAVRQAAEDRASELRATRGAWSDLLKSLDEVDARRRRTLSQMSTGAGRSS